MAHVDLSKYRPYIVIGFVVLFTLLVIWMRGFIPAADMVTPEGVNLLGVDPWYNLRQVEVAPISCLPGSMP